MEKGRFRRPSPSMAVSVTALVVALGGTGYAASQLPRNSVGADQIRTNAVRSSEIASNAVRSAEIATSAVRSEEIRDGSIAAKDLAAGVAVSGPQGPAGAAGAAGAPGAVGATGATGAQGPIGPSRALTRTRETFAFAGGSTAQQEVLLLDLPTGAASYVVTATFDVVAGNVIAAAPTCRLVRVGTLLNTTVGESVVDLAGVVGAREGVALSGTLSTSTLALNGAADLRVSCAMGNAAAVLTAENVRVTAIEVGEIDVQAAP